MNRRDALRNLCLGATSLAAARLAANLNTSNPHAQIGLKGQTMVTKQIPGTAKLFR
jgi:hypothetical protein